MKKTLITLFTIPFVVIILGITLAMIGLNWPTLIVNDTTLKIAVRYLAPFGIEAEWKEVETSHVSHGTFDATLALEFTDLCVSVRPSVEKACFPRAKGGLRYRFPGIIPSLVSLGPISLEGGEIIVHRSGKGGKFWRNFSLEKIKLPRLISKTKIFPIDVSLKSLTFTGDGSGMKITGDAHLKPDESGQVEAVTASTNITTSRGERIGIDAKATSGSHFQSGDWAIDAHLKTGLGDAGSMTIGAQFKTKDGKEIDHTLKIGYSKGELRGNFELAGLIKEKLFKSSLSGKLVGISEMVPSASLAGCELTLTRVALRKNRGKLAFTCPVDIKLKELDLPREVDPIYSQPKNVVLDVSGEADTFYYPDLSEETKAKIDARIRPQKSRLVKTTGHLEVDLQGVPAKPLETWKITSNVDLDFTIDSFASLVKVLEASPWPVPAPFYVLDGKVQFSLEGSGSSETGRATFPARLRTKLSSKKQRLDVESKGKAIFSLGRGEIGKIELDLDANFKDVQIELPNLSLAGIPAFTPDRRISLGPVEDEGKGRDERDFDYDIKMKTPSHKPIRILSNITPTFVPISINVDLKRNDMSGKIKIRDFPIHFFRRSATLNHFKLKLAEPRDKSKISGSITIPYDNFKIIVSVAGTLGEPAWALSSKPPMSRGDIISTLLYGEPLDAVGSDGAASVSSMNAAMADQKISLTTFLLLATTPIQSLGYNSDTGAFSARIRLAKKTSIVASSSDDEKTVGIRQRLGKGFSIVTGWEKWDDSSSSSGAAAGYIEWGKRW